MNIDELKKEVSKIRWWHKIDLGNGMITPGSQDTLGKLKKLGLPEDITGITVLDVGAWDGFFSFEAERRGAKRVLATDSWVWQGRSWGSKEGFELARKVLNSKVEDMEIDVLDLSPDKVGTFDLVLFLGVLYHMLHPLLALERVFSITGNQLILETHVDMLEANYPAMKFYPGAELGNDPTNWWGPNPACVEAMLKTVGFREVKVAPECLLPPYKEVNVFGLKIKKYRSQIKRIQHNRMVFHAWR